MFYSLSVEAARREHSCRPENLRELALDRWTMRAEGIDMSHQRAGIWRGAGSEIGRTISPAMRVVEC